MQQLRFHCGVCTHSQGEFALRPGQTSGALDEFAPHGAKLLESPQWCALLGGVSFLGITVHLHFPVEVMRQHGREEVDLISGLCSGRHIIHLCLRLELGKHAFLSTTSIVEGHCLFGRELLVGDDHLEVIARMVQKIERAVWYCYRTTLRIICSRYAERATTFASPCNRPGRLA